MKALDFLDSEGPPQPSGMTAEAFLDDEPKPAPGMLDQALGALKGIFTPQPAAPPPAPMPQVPNVLAQAHAPSTLPGAPGQPPPAGQFPFGIMDFAQAAPVPGMPTPSGNAAAGALEALATLQTAPVGLAAAGLKGLSGLRLENKLADPNYDFVQGVADKATQAVKDYTYQPKTEIGQKAVETIFKPLHALNEWTAGKAQEIYDNGLDITDPETGNVATMFKGDAFMATLISVVPEVAIGGLPFLGRLRKGPSKALGPARGANEEVAAGMSEGARLREILKTQGREPFEKARAEAIGKRMNPENRPTPEPAAAPKAAAAMSAEEFLGPKSRFAAEEFNARFMRPEEPPAAVQQATPQPPVVAQEPPFMPPAAPRPAPPIAPPVGPEMQRGAIPPPPPAAQPSLPETPAPAEIQAIETGPKVKGPEAFEPHEFAHEIPISEIMPREAVQDKAKLARGREHLMAGIEGRGPKRAPINVVVTPEGYKVIDGNTTLEILRGMGAESVVATVSSKLRQKDDTLDAIYKNAEQSVDEHRKYTESLASEFGGVAKFRPASIGPMKSRERALEKADNEEGGHPEYLTDILASTVLFDDPAKMKAAFDELKSRPEVYEARDRYAKPLGEYRDYNFKIRMPGTGHVSEVQFNTPAMFEAKEKFGHHFYEIDRTLPRNLKDHPGMAELSEMVKEVQRLFYGRVHSTLNPSDTQGAIRIASGSDISELYTRILNAGLAKTTWENLPSATRKSLRELASSKNRPPLSDSIQRPPLSSTPDIQSPPISEPNIPLATGNVKAKFTGSEQKLIIPGQASAPVRFALMETADIIASHDPMSFGRNAAYPADVQERLYHSDKGEQAKVVTRAQNLKTNLLLTNNPDAVNGPPIVTPEGVVLGGNSRAMLVSRAYQQDSQFGKGTHYKTKLAKFAGQFGLDPAAVEGMERPQLVRIYEPPDNEARTLRRLASDFNKSLTQGMSQEARTASMGKNVDPRLIESIGDALANQDKTIREHLETKGIEVLDRMITDGVIPAGDRSQYYSAKYNKLNDAGKDTIEKILLGSVIDDADLLTVAPKEHLNKIGRALPDIVKVKARGDAWDITPQLKQALEVVTEAKAADNKSLAQYFSQQGLFGESKNADPAVRAIAEKLWSKDGPLKFAGLWKDFARHAAVDIKKQTFLFKPKSAEEAFRDVFGGELKPAAEPAPAPTKPPADLSGMPTAELGRSLSKPLSKIEVEVTYQRPNGSEVKVKQNAQEALKEVDEQLDMAKRVLDCMEA